MVRRPLLASALLLGLALTGSTWAAHAPQAPTPPTVKVAPSSAPALSTASAFATTPTVFDAANEEGPPPAACSRPVNFCYCYPERCPAAI